MPKSKELISSDSDSNDSEPKTKKTKKAKKREFSDKGSPQKSSADAIKGDGETMYPLSKQRNISVSDYHGKAFISIREYYEKDGKMLPGRKGISLNPEQWQKLKSYIADIDKDLAKIQ